MNYKVNWATKLDYDTVLKNIVMVVYFDNEAIRLFNDNREIKGYRIVPMNDRKTTVNNGYPWYKGAFGNCLTYLNSKRTDTLYLLDNKAKDSVNKAIGKRNFCNMTDDERYELYVTMKTQLEKYALSIISREENVNAKAG